MMKKCTDCLTDPRDRSAGTQGKVLFLSVLLLGLAAHGAQFFSLAPSHDYLFSFFEREGEFVNAMELGRYLQPVYRALTGTAAATPWSIGLLTLVWIALGAFGTAAMFGIHRKGCLILLAGLMVTNQAVTATVGTYMTYLGPFYFAMMLSVFAALCWKQYLEQKKWWYLGVGVILSAVSAGLYQAFLFVTAAWILIYSILELTEGKPCRKIVLEGLLALGMILLGAAIYFALLNPALALAGVAIKQDDYNSVSNLWSGNRSLGKSLVQCYRTFLKAYTTGYATAFSRLLPIAVHGLIFLGTAAAMVHRCRRHSVKPPELVLLLALLAVLPLAALGIVILSGEIHDLMKYALCGIYLLPLLVMETREKSSRTGKWLSGGLGILMGLLIFSNIQTANLLYTEKQLEFDGTFSLMTNVLAQVEQVEGYEPGVTPVAFGGYPYEVLAELPYKEKVEHITGAELGSPITHPTKYGYFFRNILQRDVNVIMDEDLQPDTSGMPVYPGKGSVQMVDGTVIVNFHTP